MLLFGCTLQKVKEKDEKVNYNYFFSSLNDIDSIPSISQHACVWAFLAKAKKEKRKKAIFARVQTSRKKKKKTNTRFKRAWHSFMTYLPVFGVTAGWWSLLLLCDDCVNWWENATNENREPNMNLRYDYENRKATHTRACSHRTQHRSASAAARPKVEILPSTITIYTYSARICYRLSLSVKLNCVRISHSTWS